MAQIVNDWRFDFMRVHPRLFDVMPGEPEHSFGYRSATRAGAKYWRISASESKLRCRRARHLRLSASNRRWASSASTGMAESPTRPRSGSLRPSILRRRVQPVPAKSAVSKGRFTATANGLRRGVVDMLRAVRSRDALASRTSTSCVGDQVGRTCTTRGITGTPTR